MAPDTPTVRLDSPGDRLTFTLTLEDDERGNHLQRRALRYRLDQGETPVILPSGLGLVLDGQPPLIGNFQIHGVLQSRVDAHWQPLYGERATVHDFCEQAIITLHETIPPRRTLVLEVRVYDFALALRYRLPEQDGVDHVVIQDERTQFALPEGCRGWDTKRAQARYERKPIESLGTDIERPLVVECPDGRFAAIGEAGLEHNARMKLRNERGAGPVLRPQLGGEWDGQGATAGPLPWVSAWRWVMVGATPGRLVEQNDLLLNLSPACRIEQVNWIRPGKCIREVTLSTKGGRACVDFAVAHNLQYILYDAGWYGYEYDESEDATFVSVDPRRSGKVDGWDGLDLQAVIDYGKSRGVGVFLYVNRRALERQLSDLVPLFEKWGVAGIKFGFVNVGDAGWTRWVHEAVGLCAKHHLMVDIHDELRPTGMQRAYPNLLTVEGILGNEGFPGAKHNVTLPFTRFLAGPADYTICYRHEREGAPSTSDAHQMAMAAVYYSPLQLLYWYDRPAKYAGDLPELAWFDAVPTVWDDTRVLHGVIGEHITTARRSGRDWFVGSMTGYVGREQSIALSFLEPELTYTATIYADADATGQDPAGADSTIAIETRTVTAGDTIIATMKPAGGHCIHLTPRP